VVRLVVTGGSLTRKTEKVTSLSPGRDTLTNKWVPKPKTGSMSYRWERHLESCCRSKLEL